VKVLYGVSAVAMVAYLVLWAIGWMPWLVLEAFAVVLTAAVAETGNERRES